MAQPTIADVARRAGVAPSTASDILNGKLKATAETAQRVRRAAEALGYRPNALARRLRTARAEAVGLIAPFRRPLFTSGVLVDLLAGIQAGLQDAGLNLVLATRRYEGPGEAYGADLYENRAVDGVIIVGTRETMGRDLGVDVRALKAIGCPVVWLNHYNSSEPVDHIHRAGPAALTVLAEHLKSLGFTRVGRVNSAWRGGYDPAKEEPASREELAKLGLELVPGGVRGGEAYDGSAARAALDLLRRPGTERPRALLCEGDDLAAAALQTALGLGLKVPCDVAIASDSNFGLSAQAAVPITTYGAPISELGKAAVVRLAERIADPALEPKIVKVPGGLLVRASTAGG